jgi:hypothetical protein
MGAKKEPQLLGLKNRGIPYLLPAKLFLSFPLLIVWGLFIGCPPVKTKTTLDRVYELDPSGKVFVSGKLRETPPRTVAVLPFRSLIGEGRIEGSRFLFNVLGGKKENSPDSLAEKMRRAFWGQFAQLEFNHVKLSRVDRILSKEGLNSWENFRSLPPPRLGELLGAEALVFGQVTHFDYYYGLLYSQLAVGLSMEMVDSKTGEILWRVQDARRDHTVRIVFDPIGLLIGLFQAGFALRPINMMRAMDEISRELVGTIPAPPEYD